MLGLWILSRAEVKTPVLPGRDTCGFELQIAAISKSPPAGGGVLKGREPTDHRVLPVYFPVTVQVAKHQGAQMPMVTLPTAVAGCVMYRAYSDVYTLINGGVAGQSNQRHKLIHVCVGTQTTDKWAEGHHSPAEHDTGDGQHHQHFDQAEG